jgi:hypothetical protein
VVVPPLADDTERLSALVLCFLAEGTGAGVGLLGALRAMGLLAEPSSPDQADGQQDPTPTAGA